LLEQPVTLYTPILLNLIRRRGADPHNTLSGQAVWLSEDAQRQQDQAVNELLTQHGLMGPRVIDRDLLGLIQSIARPNLEYFGWFEGKTSGGSLNLGILAGSGPGGAFVAVRDLNKETVILAPERPEELLQGFLNQIPAFRPGTGAPLSVSKSEFTTGRQQLAEEGDFSVMRRGPGRAEDASPVKAIKRIMAADRTGAGTLYVAVRSQAGTRRRCQKPLNFIDTAEGRWLMEERPGRGDSLVMFTPATPQVIGQRLRNAQSALG